MKVGGELWRRWFRQERGNEGENAQIQFICEYELRELRVHWMSVTPLAFYTNFPCETQVCLMSGRVQRAIISSQQVAAVPE